MACLKCAILSAFVLSDGTLIFFSRFASSANSCTVPCLIRKQKKRIGYCLLSSLHFSSKLWLYSCCFFLSTLIPVTFS